MNDEQYELTLKSTAEWFVALCVCVGAITVFAVALIMAFP